MLLNMKNKIITACLLMIFSLTACSGEEREILDTQVTEVLEKDVLNSEEYVEDTNVGGIYNDNETLDVEIEEVTMEDFIKDKISNMTLEEKIGQMFIVVPETFSNSTTVTKASQLDTKAMKEYNIGGVILFTKNIETPKQITELNKGLNQVFDNNKLFIAVDEEGGQVARISNNSNFPDKRIENMNEVQDSSRAYEIGDTIGAYLQKYGFNLNFAPVCDVLINSQNTVVKKRSFSSNAEVVSEMANNVLNGLHNNNILASAKHFPGHGSTVEDTHYGFAISNSTIEEMEEVELLPFVELIENQVDMVMISHVIYPNLSEEETPATLNYDITTEILKNKLEYDGVIITDGMNMGAIVNNYSVEESTVMSVKAGVDIVLMPSNFYVAYESLINAVGDGEISEERIDESVTKILRLKYDTINN